MKRTLVHDAVGKTVEQTIEYAGDDGLVILFTDNTFMTIESGCYDEDDHYLCVTHTTGLSLVETHAVTIEDALVHRLIDESEAQAIRRKRDLASDVKKTERRKQEFEIGTGS